MKRSSSKIIFSGVLGVLSSIKCSLVLGTGDAGNSALACAIVEAVNEMVMASNSQAHVEMNSYPNFQGEAFVLHCDFLFKLAIFDVIELMLNYGTRRNIKTNN